MKSAVSELGLQTLSAERSPKMEIFPTWHLSVSMISVVLSFSNSNQMGVGVQAFLNFRSFDFRDFLFTAVYNLVLLSNLDLRSFCFRAFFYVSPH